jgi:hypothetical protein
MSITEGAFTFRALHMDLHRNVHRTIRYKKIQTLTEVLDTSNINLLIDVGLLEWG